MRDGKMRKFFLALELVIGIIRKEEDSPADTTV